MVRKRIVYRLHLRGRQQLLIASVGFGNAQFVRELFGSAPISGSDGDHLTAIAFLHRWDHLLHCNLGRAQNSPAHFLRHGCVSAHDVLKHPDAIIPSPTPRDALLGLKSSYASERATE